MAMMQNTMASGIISPIPGYLPQVVCGGCISTDNFAAVLALQLLQPKHQSTNTNLLDYRHYWRGTDRIIMHESILFVHVPDVLM